MADLSTDAPMFVEVVDYQEMSSFEVTFRNETGGGLQQLVLMKRSEQKVTVVHYVAASETAAKIYRQLSSQAAVGGGAASPAVDVSDGVAWAPPLRASMSNR